LVYFLRKKTRNSDVRHFRYQSLNCVHVTAVAVAIYLVGWAPVFPADLVTHVWTQVEVRARVVDVRVVHADKGDALKRDNKLALDQTKNKTVIAH